MLEKFIHEMQFLHLILQCESALLSVLEKWLPTQSGQYDFTCDIAIAHMRIMPVCKMCVMTNQASVQSHCKNEFCILPLACYLDSYIAIDSCYFMPARHNFQEEEHRCKLFS